MNFPNHSQLQQRIQLALREDLNVAGDITSLAIFAADHHSTARIVAKQQGILCGAPLIEAVFAEHDPSVTINLLAADGDSLQVEQVVATVEGPTISLLSCERTILNFLQHLSGIATMTHTYVAAVDSKISICDTRKTTPLWRDLEKYAVATGGGTNHRMGLYDMVMIKDTHADGAGGLREALNRVMHLKPVFKIAAEVRNLAETHIALEYNVDLIMLDNMDVSSMGEALALIAGKAETEMTGNVSLESLPRLSGLQANRASVGKITHSAPALDFSMRIQV